MTDKTPETSGLEEDDLLSRLALVQQMFADVRSDLSALRDELMAGGEQSNGGRSKRLESIRSDLATCVKLETDIEKLRDSRRGYVEGRKPIDLGAARLDVSRALDRLRAARGAGEIFE